MKKAVKVLGSWVLSAGLLSAYAYLWIAFGVGNDLTLLRKVLLSGGALAIAAAVVAGALLRGRIAGVLQAAALAAAAGLVVEWELGLRAERAAVPQRNIEANAQLVAKGLAVLECRDGSTAVLTTLRHFGDDADALAISLVPRERDRPASVLVSTNNRHAPVSDEGLRRYLINTGNDCGNGEYRSLLELMPRLRAHDEAWRRARGLPTG